MLWKIVLLAAVAVVASEGDELNVATDQKVVYSPPMMSGNAFLAETFDQGLGSRWVKSEAKKDDTDEEIAKYNAEWEVKESDRNLIDGDKGLVLTTRARHAAITAKLNKPFKFTGKPLVVQYEVTFQNGMECGGAYIKLLSDSASLNLKQVTDKSPYTIMFGPDTCGVDKKLHFIMRHKNPKTGQFEEKHAKKPSGDLNFYADKKTHLFRLVVNPDSTWEIDVDGAVMNTGSLLTDMDPPINPPAEIDDPLDSKPEDWDDREKIPDADATKPIDWDEEAPEFILDEEAVKPDGWLEEAAELIPDPSASKPADWDDEMDGEWEPALVENPDCASAPGCGEWKRPTKRNPEYRGKWSAPMIQNPAYSGVWAPRKIANPDYFEDKEPYKMTPIGALVLELWSMSDGLLFDNFLITDDLQTAEDWTTTSWKLKSNAEMAAAAAEGGSWYQPVLEMTEDKPWLWAVFVIAALVPVCLVAYCCCMGSKENAAADAKKTDASTPDDQPEEGEEASGGGDTSPTKKSARDDLFQKDESGDDDNAEDGGASQEEGGASQEEGGASQEEGGASQEEGGASGDASQEDTEPRRTSPRKRRPRKE